MKFHTSTSSSTEVPHWFILYNTYKINICGSCGSIFYYIYILCTLYSRLQCFKILFTHIGVYREVYFHKYFNFGGTRKIRPFCCLKTWKCVTSTNKNRRRSANG